MLKLRRLAAAAVDYSWQVLSAHSSVRVHGEPPEVGRKTPAKAALAKEEASGGRKTRRKRKHDKTVPAPAGHAALARSQLEQLEAPTRNKPPAYDWPPGSEPEKIVGMWVDEDKNACFLMKWSVHHLPRHCTLN